MRPQSSAPERAYAARAETLAAARERAAARSRRLVHARVVTFAAGVGLLLWAELSGLSALALVGGLALVAFAALLPVHARAREAERWIEALEAVNADGPARLARDWDALKRRAVPADVPPGHAYAADLDLFGRASLRRLLGSAGAPPGEAALRAWLLAPSSPDVVQARQAAVRELAPLLELRQEVAAHARVMGRTPAGGTERFLDWTEEPDLLATRPTLVAATILLPAATLALMGAHAFDVAPWAWLAPLALQTLLDRRWGGAVRETLDRAFPPEEVFRGYAALFRLFGEPAFEAPLLRRLQDELSAGGEPAHRHISRLARLAGWADSRFNSYHWLIHGLTLWNFHVLRALERWKRRVERRPRHWFPALGQAEALAALAALAFDHPDWAFPELAAEGAARFEAEALGHPLLREGVRVHNDVAVGPPGTVLLVTGSNMSGKSTLLRAIGVAAVLAQAGAPVCARRLRLTPLRPFTSIRISDSLEEGVSLFMAELKRLKQVVTAAERSAAGPTLLYLLDEILHGTNSAERHQAARRILRHLVAEGAIGAVTTHDLALADAPELADAVRPVHFRETVHPQGGEGPAMSFDYELRPGIATTTNALRLMAAVGLGFEDDAADGAADDENQPS